MSSNASSGADVSQQPVATAVVLPPARPKLDTLSVVYHVAYAAYGVYFLVCFALTLLNTPYVLAHGYLLPARLGVQGGLMLGTSIAVLLRNRGALNLSRASAALYCVSYLFGGGARSGIALVILFCHYGFMREPMFPTFGRKRN